MTSKDNQPADAAKLRKRAEKLAREEAAQSPEKASQATPSRRWCDGSEPKTKTDVRT
jgi:hypothetical protein